MASLVNQSFAFQVEFEDHKERAPKSLIDLICVNLRLKILGNVSRPLYHIFSTRLSTTVFVYVRARILNFSHKG